MTVGTARTVMKLTVTDEVTDAAGYVNSRADAVTFDGGNLDTTLSSATTPDVTGHGVGVLTLTAGAGTLDLTSLTGPNSVAVSLSGKKPRAVLLENTGANPMTVAKGASNGYTGFGSAYSETIPAGGKVLKYLGANGTAVSGSVKTLDVSGTGAQVLKYQIVGGT